MFRPQSFEYPLPPVQGGPSPTLLTHAHVQDMFDAANDSVEANYWRGYRFTPVEILDVGAPCGPCSSSEPGYWYARAIPNEDSEPDNLKTFETIAKQTPAFAWNSSAINLYINEGMVNGAVCSSRRRTMTRTRHWLSARRPSTPPSLRSSRA